MISLVGWNGWRIATGVICDKKNISQIKSNMYEMLVKPAILHGLETVALSKRKETELEVVEMTMSKLSLAVTRLEKIKNKLICRSAHVRQLENILRDYTLRWFGHVQRRDADYKGRKMLKM